MPSLCEFVTAHRRSRQLDPIFLPEPVPLEALHTPALIIDLDAFERNLGYMQSFLAGHGLGLRPHTKMHKCPVIAKMQLDRGALGVCTAKVSEAEVMADAGVADILITSPLVTGEKQMRFIDLVREAPGVKVVVDSKETVRDLDGLASGLGLKPGVFVDMDPGMGRTGVEAGEPVLELVSYILDHCDAVSFEGLQMYAGNCMHTQGFDARKSKYERVMSKGLGTRDLLERAGIDVRAFSGGGTGTYNIEPTLGLVTELQAGSYAFMDIEYRDIGSCNGAVFDDFPVSLFLLSTAISQPQPRLITFDAGFKSLASDKMLPEFRDVQGVIYHWGGDEHGIVELIHPSASLSPGDKLPLVTPHCDPTVNLHDFYFPYRDGVVSEIWPISARGCSQ